MNHAHVSVVAPRIVLILSGRCRLLWDSLSAYWSGRADAPAVRVIQEAAELSALTLDDVPVVMLQEIPVDPGQVLPSIQDSLPRDLDVRVIGLLTEASERYLVEAVEANLWSCASLLDSARDLFHVVQDAADGRRAVSPSLSDQLVLDHVTQQLRIQGRGVLEQLTHRQREILGKLAAGDSVKQVARAMHLSSKTIESHKYRIMQKLGLHDRVQITRLAIREGLLAP